MLKQTLLLLRLPMRERAGRPVGADISSASNRMHPSPRIVSCPEHWRHTKPLPLCSLRMRSAAVSRMVIAIAASALLIAAAGGRGASIGGPTTTSRPFLPTTVAATVAPEDPAIAH